MNNELINKMSAQAYRNGLEDAWNAARKIVRHFHLAVSTCHQEPFVETFGDESLMERFENHTASEAIERLTVWEQKVQPSPPDKSKAIQKLAEGIADINLEEIKSHDTEDRLDQWIKSWKAYMQKWLYALEQEDE